MVRVACHKLGAEPVREHAAIGRTHVGESDCIANFDGITRAPEPRPAGRLPPERMRQVKQLIRADPICLPRRSKREGVSRQSIAVKIAERPSR